MFYNYLSDYNGSITYQQVKWRSNSELINFNFFNDNQTVIIDKKSGVNVNLFNSTSSDYIDNLNEPRGTELTTGTLNKFDFIAKKKNS